MKIPDLQTRIAATQKPVKRTRIMYQRWTDLLFLHWEYDAADLQGKLPAGLHVDTHEGKAYVSLLPFFVWDTRPRGLPAVGWLSNFLETNLRTYVYDDAGAPGIWFFSLDASQPIAVQLARLTFGLPYFTADMSGERDPDGLIHYTLLREGQPPQKRLVYEYRPTGEEPHTAEPGTLEYFLIERYLLFTVFGGKLMSGRVFHRPYPISNPEVRHWDDRLFGIDGLSNPNRAPDLTHLSSQGVEVDVYSLKEARTGILGQAGRG